MTKQILLNILLIVAGICKAQVHDDVSETKEIYQPWQEGYLDIHHIHTGGGDAAFFIFPDGTTMLFDAGDMDVNQFNEKWAPLRAADPYPNDSISAGERIARYIKEVFPKDLELKIDYALISHFHSDHYGNVKETSRLSQSGDYKLTGITQVDALIPIDKIIDRNYPDYNYPVDLGSYYKNNPTFLNYLSFIDYKVNKQGSEAAILEAGSRDQISLKRHPERYQSFFVRNVKVNGDIWTGQADSAFTYLKRDSLLNSNGNFNENPLSLALKISYGNFDYFTGGDMTGLQGYGQPGWFDVETPVSKAVGKVEVTTLNHHGNRDATNENFVANLAPRVIVQQSWCSDHPGMEVFHRLTSKDLYTGPRDIFSTYIHDETKVTFGPWFTKAYNSMKGHIVVRVEPGSERYYVYILDDTKPKLYIKNIFGPYETTE
ncbi:MBL fold metallo-hydrolase [Fulvivirgaceae bacterium BMA10]|uniref:MBL fold metallo-hydrolase n=1 Tax=Splendidivirga corallicola TaxID=3051826 RepID=A0ABT8KJF6_9BACT|nr:MBL fold metallo-hydrolase [Fulvivirgaceae bacterium BMA10]